MAAVSMPPPERSRKNVQVVLQALAVTGQAEVARHMGVSESTVSRMKDGTIDQLGALMAHLGLKVVPAGMLCFDPAYVDALKTLAEVGIRQPTPRTLDWSESA